MHPDMPRPVVLLLCSALLVGCPGEPPPPPDLVLFVLDTVRADGLSTNGHPVELTPAIDRLAAEGVSFRNAFAHSTWTKPSMATLFTGRYADEHRVRTPVAEVGERKVAERLRPELVTLAERLREGGYTTAAFVNQVHLQPKFGFDQGFDHYAWSTGRSAHEVNAQLLAWLESPADGEDRAPEGALSRERPLFLYLHYLDPHWPYRERVDELRDAIGSLGVHPRPPHSGDRVDEWLAAGLAPGSIDGLRARYDHGVAYTDRAVGFALEILERNGLLEDAVVVVTSDHGEGFLEHGELQHGYPPYDEVAQVPLVVWRSRPFPVREVEAPVGLVDLMPTLLELAGLAAGGPGMRGRSLVPLLEGAHLGARPIYLETGGVRGLRTETEKVLVHADGEIEYFDLSADPAEARPLPCEGPCVDLVEQLALLGAVAAGGELDPDDTVELDAADLERLRALGYLND